MFIAPPPQIQQLLSIRRGLWLIADSGMKLLFLLLSSLSILSGLGEGQEVRKEEDGKAGILSVASKMEWSTAFALKGEHELAKDSLLTTLPKMTKEWRVSFEVNPTDYSFNGYASVLHLTAGGKGVGSGAKEGDRNPAIWIHRSRGILVSTAMNGKVAYSKIIRKIPPVGEWTSIEVSQELFGSEYIYSITIADKNVFEMINTKPLEVDNVKVYAGSPWNTARKGFIRDLEIEIKVPSEGPTGTGCVQAGKDALSVSPFFFVIIL